MKPGQERGLDHCGPTGKIRYRSIYSANQALTERTLERQQQGADTRRERRAYFCIKCNGFHLTSQPRHRREEGELEES